METMILSANLDALAQISLFIADAAEYVGLDDRTTWQIQLAVDEAATNIIQYAYDPDCPGHITLSWQRNDNAFTVTLQDTGRGFDPDEVPPPDLLSPLEERQVGGLGIYLMTRLMDEVHFHFDPQYGNVLTMVKYLTVDETDDTAVLPINGRLDASNVALINKEAQKIIERGVRYLIIDLCNVYFMSSSGLRILLIIRKELMTLGGELHLACLQSHVLEVFELTGFTQVFTIHPTVDAARHALRNQHK
ncbi:MAG: anti-sigma factor antagonist [Chloroflexaceae bacterium]|nr:anti-sigma factor antagonist [Chloroflexaceae bacterium]